MAQEAEDILAGDFIINGEQTEIVVVVRVGNDGTVYGARSNQERVKVIVVNTGDLDIRIDSLGKAYEVLKRDGRFEEAQEIEKNYLRLDTARHKMVRQFRKRRYLTRMADVTINGVVARAEVAAPPVRLPDVQESGFIYEDVVEQ